MKTWIQLHPSASKVGKVGGGENALISSSKPCAAENKSLMVHIPLLIQGNSDNFFDIW